MDVLRAIAEWRTPFLDDLFLILTKLGEEAGVIVAVAVLYWCVSKKTAYGLGFAYFFSGLAVNSLKIGCRIDRPWILDPAFKAVEAAKAHATSYSFPSGHTQSATALYGTLGLKVRNGWLKALFLSFIPIVGFSRMYLGVHTPADVLVSFGVTGAIVVMFALLCRDSEPSVTFFAVAGSVLAACAFAALGYSLHLHSRGVIAYDYASDISKMVGAAIGFAAGCILERKFIDFDPRDARLWQHAVKLVVGIGVTLGLKAGLKPIFALIDSQSLVLDALRYAILILWVVVVWPAVFSRLFSPSGEKDAAAQN